MTTVLILPGYQNSGPEHWQTLWEQENPGYLRVQERDWDNPVLDEWVAELHNAVHSAPDDVVLVAHSLGCIQVAHWAARHTGSVKAALLVAPADIDTVDIPELINFRPIPLTPLPFPTIVVASSNDPYATIDRSRLFADTWGARLVEAGPLGHINSDSALGPWPEGFTLLNELMATNSNRDRHR